MKVLVALDDSEFSKLVLQDIAEREWSFDTQFMVINVLAVPSMDRFEDIGFSVSADITARLRAESEKLLTESCSYLKEHLGDNIELHHKVVEGHTCDAIVHEAKDWNADLIMVGSHGRSGLAKLIMGSVTEGVLYQAPCSVEIIKSRSKTKQPPKPKKKLTGIVY
jgi:nucleotide-binding universal stress UspA family protein